MAYKTKKPVFQIRKKGTLFRVRETGQNWTIDVKEKEDNKFKRVQAVNDLKLAKQIIFNQREFN